MAKKLAAPQWLKDNLASLRSQRAAGDVAPSELRELLADEISDRHKKGDPFERLIVLEYVDRLDRDTMKAHQDKVDEVTAAELAAGFLQDDLFPAEALAELGLPAVLDLGGFGKSIDTPDATRGDIVKYLAELERKRKSWDSSLGDRIAAAERILDLLPEDGSRTVRDVITDPEDYGFGQAAL